MCGGRKEGASLDEKCRMDAAQECAGVTKMTLLQAQLDELRRSAHNTHEQMFKRIRDMEIAMAETRVEYGNIMKALGGLEADLKTLREKPAKRWDSLVDKAVWAVLAAVIAFILGRVGL